MHRAIRPIALLAVTAAALAACSSGGGSSAAEDDLRDAVQASTKTINEADVSGMRQYTSARCLKRQTDDERRDLAEMVNTLYGDITLKDITISDLSDTKATVSAKTGIEALDKDDFGAPWVKEDGAWKNDSC